MPAGGARVEMSWGVAVAAGVVVALLLVVLAIAGLVILAGGGVFLLRRRSAATAVTPPRAPERAIAPTSVPESEEPRTVRMHAEGRAPSKSLSGFPSLPPGGRLEPPLVPPTVPGLKSITPSSPPPPPKKASGLIGFFDEPPSDTGDAAKTELFQRGKMDHAWEEDNAEGGEATEIFSALTHELGDEGFADDDETTRGKRK